MRELSPHTRIYMVLVVVAGYLALGDLFLRTNPDPVTKLLALVPLNKLVVLLLLALTCGPLKLRGASVSMVFVYAGLFALPARYGTMVAMAAAAGRLLFGDGRRPKLRDWLFDLSAMNLSFLVAYDAHHTLGRDTLAGLGVSALLFFLISTWSRAAADGLAANRPVAKLWRRESLPAAPIYGAMAVAGAWIDQMLAPSWLHTFVLAFPVLCLVYYCYEYYCGRLASERCYVRQLADTHQRTVEALALAIDAKDQVTSGHLRRVQRYAVAVGRRMRCNSQELKALEVGALLHDIGKIAVPEHLLAKPGKLTRQEFQQVAIHPQVGAEILAAVRFPFPVDEVVHCHHENWDGSGYPRGLKGTEIPLAARILSVTDCFDALLSDRPYRPAFPRQKAIAMVKDRRGTAFDPQVVDLLMEMLPEFGAEMAQAAVDSSPHLTSPRSIDAVQTSLSPEELLQARSLREVYDAVAGGEKVEEILETAASEISRLIAYDDCGVFLRDGDRLEARYLTFAPRPMQVPLREGPTGWAAARGETLANANPASERAELGRAARARGWNDSLVVPLWNAGKVIGVLSLYATSPGAYQSYHARCLELLTANLGLTLARAQTPAAVAAHA